MANPDGYTSIMTYKEARDKARETKNELGLTWEEFLEQAANELSE